MSPKIRLAGVLSIIAGFAVTVNEANAASVTFSGSDSFGRSASVSFVDSGSTLAVTLTNTSPADVMVPIDVLTGVFFDVVGSPALTRVSAILNAGSTVLFGTPDPGGVVGGEWAYKSGLSGAPGTATEGISSTGLGLFGPGNRFPGTNLQGPTSPNGLEYGITSAGDDSTTGNTPVTGTQALIKNSVVFTLSGFVAGSTFSNVSFQYGTDLSEPNVPGNPDPPGGPNPGVPEPSSLLLAGVGMAFALRCRGRRK